MIVWALVKAVKAQQFFALTIYLAYGAETWSGIRRDIAANVTAPASIW
jgi:hypothetical protein